MSTLLQITTYGMKGLENEFTLDFCNLTIDKGFSKINKIKGIFGLNGAGKTSFISSVLYYKSIVTRPYFLTQTETIRLFDKLINKRRKEFYFSITFMYDERTALKHTIIVKKSNVTNDYVIEFEKLSLLSGRTLNESEKLIYKKENKSYVFNFDNEFKYKDLFASNLDNSTILSVFINECLSKKKSSYVNHPDQTDKYMVSIFSDIFMLNAFIEEGDKHNLVYFNVESLSKLFAKCLTNTLRIDENQNINIDDDIVPKKDIEKYKQDNMALEKFIKIFKPELKSIKLELSEDRDKYHIKRNFVYKYYTIESEYESSGIKQLVKLFSYFKKCAEGQIVFIDEVDVNINSIYFKKLISYFVNYGKGQFIFTTHNVDVMDELKHEKKSIVFMGDDNSTYTRVSHGNNSPRQEFLGGYIPNVTTNIEGFDFINIFEGEM